MMRPVWKFFAAWIAVLIIIVFAQALLPYGAGGLAVQGIFLFAAFSASYLVPYPAGMYAGRREALRARLSLKSLPISEGVLIALAAVFLLPALSMFSDLIASLFPGYSEYSEALQTGLEYAAAEYGFAALFCLMALLPAVCEEFFFRGYLASALRESGTCPTPLAANRPGACPTPLAANRPGACPTPLAANRPGLLTRAVLGGFVFALFHLDIWRFLPMFAIGVLTVWLVERCGSILASVIYHFVNNAMIFGITLAASRSEGDIAPAGEGADLAADQVFLVLLMALLGALALIRLARKAGLRRAKTSSPSGILPDRGDTDSL